MFLHKINSYINKRKFEGPLAQFRKAWINQSESKVLPSQC